MVRLSNMSISKTIFCPENCVNFGVVLGGTHQGCSADTVGFNSAKPVTIANTVS